MSCAFCRIFFVIDTLLTWQFFKAMLTGNSCLRQHSLTFPSDIQQEKNHTTIIEITLSLFKPVFDFEYCLIGATSFTFPAPLNHDRDISAIRQNATAHLNL